jgi:hypothetical protein
MEVSMGLEIGTLLLLAGLLAVEVVWLGWA